MHHSPVAFLSHHLDLGPPDLAAYTLACFTDYALNFLQAHPDVLDPDLAQVTARVRLTVAHEPVGWLWRQHTRAAKRRWGHDEHAADFVLRVLDSRPLPAGCGLEAAVCEIHRRLCILQSIFLGSGAWVEDEGQAAVLRLALLAAMEQMRFGLSR